MITLRVQNRCDGLAVEGMNLCFWKQICVRNFIISDNLNLIVFKSLFEEE